MSTVPFLCHKAFPLEGVPALSYTFCFHGHWAQNTTTWHMVVQKTRQWLEFGSVYKITTMKCIFITCTLKTVILEKCYTFISIELLYV